MIRRPNVNVSQNSDKAGAPAPDHYARLHASFEWLVPEKFNIAQACCARWAALPDAASRVAVHATDAAGARASLTYLELQQQANRLSCVLTGLGVQRGDRVAIVMPQRFETAVAYMAVLQMGAVAMPLSMLFGPEAIEYRLRDGEAVLAICDESSIASVAAVRPGCPLLRSVLGVGGAHAAGADLDYRLMLARAAPLFTPVETGADQAAVLIYTSGTTGNPKGALIPHRALIGNLSGFVCSQNWFGFNGRDNKETQAVFWSPADWAWTGGLMDALLPTLYFGRPIIAFNGRFSPQMALQLMRQFGVTHTFLFPTALKALMKAYPGSGGATVRQQYGLRLQAIMSAGEAVGDAVFDYCEAQLGVTVNEMFGQTEINYIVGNCAVHWPARPGSMGKGYPGHRVAVIDDAAQECPVGVAGDVALNRFDVHGQPDPIFFLGYWKNEAATRDKFSADWCRTGDLATRDADGYLWYQGRSDDVFKAAGYRIGPGEIENCLVKHPAVANAAVVPKPDRERGAVVKAYVVLAADFVSASGYRPGADPQFEADLVARLQAHVREKLAPYEYPKEIEFIEALPMTTTGKVQRRVLRLQEVERARVRGEGEAAPRKTP
ncbi:MAG: acyl-CoA synthetase [Rhodoferax sp.]